MELKLKYGQSEIPLEIPDANVAGVLTLPEFSAPITDLASAVRAALNKPLGMPPLSELVKTKKPKNVVIVLEDITRPNPDYTVWLGELVSELKSAGVKSAKFIIAYGTHRKHKPEETKRIYGAVPDGFGEVYDHDCDDAANLVSLGKLSTGNDLKVNRHAAEADFVVLTGNIEPHSFAGYGGGRKAILPGISSRQTITANHAKVALEGVVMGKLENNPIHLEMLEAARTFEKNRTTFILEVIRNDKKKPMKVVAGDMEKAFYEGVEFASKLYTVMVPEYADAAIVSSGGYPKDLNLYQSQKSVTAASRIVRDGGTVILLAECRDGVGQAVFERWMVGLPVKELIKKREHEIEVEGHRAYLTAKILNRMDVVVVSSIHAGKMEELKFCSADSMESAVAGLKKKFGPDYKAYIIPNGASIIPTVQK